jgi:DNA-binding NtrC family response regulator
MFAYQIEPKPTTDPPALSRPIALLLCRDDEVRVLAAQWLSEADFCVQIVGDGDDASARMSQGKFNLLILNGFCPRHPTLDRLLTRKDSAPLQVLLIPSSGDRPLVGIAQLQNVDAVLPRPLTRAAFFAALEPFNEEASRDLDGRRQRAFDNPS